MRKRGQKSSLEDLLRRVFSFLRLCFCQRFFLLVFFSQRIFSGFLGVFPGKIWKFLLFGEISSNQAEETYVVYFQVLRNFVFGKSNTDRSRTGDCGPETSDWEFQTGTAGFPLGEVLMRERQELNTNDTSGHSPNKLPKRIQTAELGESGASCALVWRHKNGDGLEGGLRQAVEWFLKNWVQREEKTKSTYRKDWEVNFPQC